MFQVSNACIFVNLIGLENRLDELLLLQTSQVEALS